MISAAHWQGWGQVGLAGAEDSATAAGRRLPGWPRPGEKRPLRLGRKGREGLREGRRYLQQSSTLKKAAAPAPQTGQDSTGPWCV